MEIVEARWLRLLTLRLGRQIGSGLDLSAVIF